MNFLYQAILAVIATNFPNDYPSIDTSDFQGYPIFAGQQNNYAIPANGKYVIITLLSDENQILNPRSIANLTDESQQFSTMVSSTMQVDFYGTNAQTNARIFQMLINSDYANTFFIDNSYACSVNRVEPVRNLSDTLGRDMYIQRFMVKLSLFNNPNFTTPVTVFDGVTNIIRFVQ